MRTIIFTALTVLAAAAATVPAAAETLSVRVSYEDLDLTRPDGLATLNGRIKAAARKVCGSANARRIMDGADHQRCMQAVSSSTAIQIARAMEAGPVLAFSDNPRR